MALNPYSIALMTTDLESARSLRLSVNERRLLCNAIASAIQNQTELIHANYDRYSEKPIEGMEGYIRKWCDEIRAWKKLSVKLSSPNKQDEPHEVITPNDILNHE